MKKVRFTLILMTTLLIFGGCREKSSSVTGAFGNAVLQGQVVNASGSGEEGVEVRVRGTGLATVTGSDGRFLLTGVPGSDIELLVTGGGREITRTVVDPADPVTINLAGRSSRSRGRGAGRPGVELEGTIVAVTSTSLSVDAIGKGVVEVAITESTNIFKGPHPATSEQLVVGERVHVRAVEQEGVLTAISVTIHPAGDPGYVVNIRGIVVSVGAESMIVTTEGGDVEVLVNELTEIFKGRTSIPFASIVPGDAVRVKGTPSGEALLASRIVVHSDHGEGEDVERVEVEGVVTTVGADSLVIETDAGPVTLLVTETTVIRRGHEPLALSEILPGDVVEARGIEVSPGVIEADKIQVESPELEEAEVVGVVQSVGDASLVIETETDGVLTVNVTDRTRIKRRGNPIALSDIFPGDLVEVGGVWVDASTILASAIAVEVQEMEIEGTVDSIEGDAFVVSTAEGPITVVVTSATRFKRGSANVSLTDLVVGDLVEVKGFRIDDTTIEAHRVSIEESEDEGDDEGEGDEEEPEAVEVDGTILEIGDAAFAIETDEGVVTVQVNAETQFELGEDVILYADLRVGDEVEVEGFWISDTAIDAVRVSAEIAD